MGHRPIYITHTDERPFSLNQVDEFIEEIDTTANPREVYNVLKYYIEQLGYHRFSYQVIEAPTGQQKKFYISTYPAEWVKRYNELKYISVDIRGRVAGRSLRPFAWHEIGNLSDFTEAQQNHIKEAMDFGIRAGGIVPICGPGPIKALLAVTSELPEEEFARFFITTRHILHLMATYAHERLVQMGFHEKSPRTLKLTPREVEVLTWAARGAKSEYTADKLSISVETVTRHITNICNKLGATNKTHAVSIGLLYGLIIP